MSIRRLVMTLGAALLAWGAAAQEPAPAPAKPLVANPADDLFLVAQLAYQEANDARDPGLRKANFEAAVQQFSRFLRFHPKHEKALEAWYYSAVCYQKLGQDESARRCLNAVVEDGRTGRLAGAAAAQLADYHYGQKEWSKAAGFFAVATKANEDKATRQLALFYSALCFQKLGKTDETMKVLEEVLADPESPFRSRAEIVLAHYYRQNGREKEALVLFERLAKSGDQKTRADATLQVALLARDLKQAALAESYFEKILTTPGLEEWRGEAQLVLMSGATRREEFQRVVDLFKKGDYKLKKEQQIDRIRLAAQAYESLGQTDATAPLYRQLEQLSPQTKTGFDAAYVLLSRAYNANRKDFITQATQFLARYEKLHPDNVNIHNARLMIGETHFKAKAWAEAAKAYATIDLARIDAKNHIGIRYRLATAYLEAGDFPGAIKAFTEFLLNHPEDPRCPNILAKRADAYLAGGQSAEALRDFERLLTSTTDPALLEYAWLEKAEIHKAASQLPEFIDCHRHLLADLPKRSKSQQAASHFWIGRSLFQLNQVAEAVPHFQQARDGDPAKLGRDATRHLVLSYYTLEQAAELETELERLMTEHPQLEVPRRVFAWLGVKLANEQKNYEKAWRFLPRAVTPDKPEETETLVWRAHARTALETGRFRSAVPSLMIMIERDEGAFQRAESYYFLARANFGLNAIQEARNAAEEALALKPLGKLNAEIRLLLGDLALAEDDPGTAVKFYVLVAELYSSDPEIEKSALRRAAAALGDLGDAESLKEAKRYRERLRILDQAARENP